MEVAITKDYRTYLFGVAILWIIVFHYLYYSALFEQPLFEAMASNGYFGVDIFLFLSSYGLCYSFNDYSIKGYYCRRFKRLFPLYFLFLAIVFFFFHNNYTDSPILLFLLQCTGLSCFRTVDVEWYIPALILIYATFPILYKACKHLYNKWQYSLIVIILLLGMLCKPLSTVIVEPLANRLGVIIIGICTYLAVMEGNNSFLRALLLSLVTFVFVFKCPYHVIGSLLAPVIIIGLSAVDPHKMPFYNCISFVGQHSLEIYLAQSLALNHYFLHNQGPFIQKTLISFAILLTASVLFHWFQKSAWTVIEKLT